MLPSGQKKTTYYCPGTGHLYHHRYDVNDGERLELRCSKYNTKPLYCEGATYCRPHLKNYKVRVAHSCKPDLAAIQRQAIPEEILRECGGQSTQGIRRIVKRKRKV